MGCRHKPLPLNEGGAELRDMDGRWEGSPWHTHPFHLPLPLILTAGCSAHALLQFPHLVLHLFRSSVPLYSLMLGRLEGVFSVPLPFCGSHLQATVMIAI